mgnify:CR=1 FL=1
MNRDYPPINVNIDYLQQAVIVDGEIVAGEIMLDLTGDNLYVWMRRAVLARLLFPAKEDTSCQL